MCVRVHVVPLRWECVDPLGWRVVCPRLAEGTDAIFLPRAEKVVVHMHRSTRHRERTLHALQARARGTRV